MSEIEIGDVKIPRKYVRHIITAIGGYVSVYGAALDADGAKIEGELSKLKKDNVYQLYSTDVSGIVKVKEIKVDKKTESGRDIHIFNVSLQIIA